VLELDDECDDELDDELDDEVGNGSGLGWPVCPQASHKHPKRRSAPEDRREAIIEL